MALVHKVTVTFSFSDGDEAQQFANEINDNDVSLDDLPEFDEAVVENFTTEDDN